MSDDHKLSTTESASSLHWKRIRQCPLLRENTRVNNELLGDLSIILQANGPYTLWPPLWTLMIGSPAGEGSCVCSGVNGARPGSANELEQRTRRDHRRGLVESQVQMGWMNVNRAGRQGSVGKPRFLPRLTPPFTVAVYRFPEVPDADVGRLATAGRADQVSLLFAKIVPRWTEPARVFIARGIRAALP